MKNWLKGRKVRNAIKKDWRGRNVFYNKTSLEYFKWDVTIHQYSGGMIMQQNFSSELRNKELAKHEKS